MRWAAIPAEFAESLREGRGGIGQIESTDITALRFQNGAEVKNYSHQPYFEDRRADFMDRFAQFAVIAAREAVQDAGVEWTPELRETSAIITGSCVGGQSTEDIGFVEIYKKGTQPGSSADHSQDDGQRGRQPHLDGVRHHRAGLHDFDGVLFGRARHRAGVSDDRHRGHATWPSRAAAKLRSAWGF